MGGLHHGRVKRDTRKKHFICTSRVGRALHVIRFPQSLANIKQPASSKAFTCKHIKYSRLNTHTHTDRSVFPLLSLLQDRRASVLVSRLVSSVDAHQMNTINPFDTGKQQLKVYRKSRFLLHDAFSEKNASLLK
ncbi:unnamed protein product [Ectocarpus sp. 4 AP-2014]